MADDEIHADAPAIASARIVRHPRTGRDCLLARDEEGRRLAFAFDAEGDAPGVSLVDPDLWLEQAGVGEPELGPRRFEVFDQPWADEWLAAIVADPAGNEWLAGIKREHPDAFRTWFALEQYDEGGEEGAG